MGISDSIIHAWRAAEKKSKGQLTGPEEKQTSALEEEIESLKRQLRQTEMDRTAEAARNFKKSCRHFQPTDLSLTYQFIPKKKDFSQMSHQEVKTYQERINDRPRKNRVAGAIELFHPQ